MIPNREHTKIASLPMQVMEAMGCWGLHDPRKLQRKICVNDCAVDCEDGPEGRRPPGRDDNGRENQRPHCWHQEEVSRMMTKMERCPERVPLMVQAMYPPAPARVQETMRPVVA